MNPLLLKSGGRRESTGEYLCSVVVRGKHLCTEDYGALGNRTEELRSLILDAHHRLGEQTDAQIVVIEGAGSCTELNLMDRDVVNLPLVRQLNCPWLLVANIDPGGVFAQIVGTKACVSERDWELCAGIVVNKLRGSVF
jgi:adenosylcobyric acid synthase